jgi:hypothetical protein
MGRPKIKVIVNQRELGKPINQMSYSSVPKKSGHAIKAITLKSRNLMGKLYGWFLLMGKKNPETQSGDVMDKSGWSGVSESGIRPGQSVSEARVS